MKQIPDDACVLALGFFDGVHLGHAELMKKTVERAVEIGAVPAVMTFDTHPDTLVFGKPVPLINSATDRAWLIRRTFGIDRVEFYRFTEETMRTPWDRFLEEICEDLHCVHFVVGYDFTFGWKGQGNVERLREFCSERSLGLDVIGQVQLDGVTVSSSYIRTLLLQGDMPGAAKFMGHPHVLTDVVRRGHRLGRRLGMPTINMQFPEGVLVPPHGVYASRVVLDGGRFPAVTNVGVRPTVSSNGPLSVESHILDFSGSLYGRTVALEFFDHLRDERRFDSLEELSQQIERDAERSRAIVEGYP